MLGEQGHADAGTHLKLQVAEHDRKAERVLQLLCPLQWVFAGCELVSAHEFIATHARKDIILGAGRAKPGRQLAEHVVTHDEAMGVVDFLEAVEVHKQHSDRHACLPGLVEHLLRQHHAVGAVGQAGERVVKRQALHGVLGGLAVGDVQHCAVTANGLVRAAFFNHAAHFHPAHAGARLHPAFKPETTQAQASVPFGIHPNPVVLVDGGQKLRIGERLGHGPAKKPRRLGGEGDGTVEMRLPGADVGHRLGVEQFARELCLFAQVFKHQQQALLVAGFGLGQCVGCDAHGDGQRVVVGAHLQRLARALLAHGGINQRRDMGHIHHIRQRAAAQVARGEAKQVFKRPVGKHHLQIGRGHHRAVGQVGKRRAIVAQVGNQIVAVGDVAVDGQPHIEKHHLDERLEGVHQLFGLRFPHTLGNAWQQFSEVAAVGPQVPARGQAHLGMRQADTQAVFKVGTVIHACHQGLEVGGLGLFEAVQCGLVGNERARFPEGQQMVVKRFHEPRGLIAQQRMQSAQCALILGG